MTELIADFYCSACPDVPSKSSADLLFEFGKWLNARGITRSVIATAYRAGIPVFCPAIQDSPYGDAALVARRRGKKIGVDAFSDYDRFMSLAPRIKTTGVVYVGGGVPKDFIQLFAVTPDLRFPEGRIPGRSPGYGRAGGLPTYYPHRYAVQITTDSPQWGGLSGCTFDEAVSWGKETFQGECAQCYCDATIALPVICQALAERLAGFSRDTKANRLVCELVQGNSAPASS
jgi:deoxyhypusine synthase